MPVLLGVIAGVLEFIPLVGPFLAAVIATLVAAFHAPILALRVVGFLAALRLLHDYVVYPRLVGRGLHHLHPFVVVIAGLAGVELGGVVGLFVAVPAAAIMSVVYRHWLEERSPAAAHRTLLDALTSRQTLLPHSPAPPPHVSNAGLSPPSRRLLGRWVLRAEAHRNRLTGDESRWLERSRDGRQGREEGQGEE